jgi:prophage regulatory protein
MSLDRILRMPELVEITGLSAATIYRLIGKGRFPRGVSLGPQARGWKASAVAAWFAGLQPAGLRGDDGGEGGR